MLSDAILLIISSAKVDFDIFLILNIIIYKIE